MVTSFENMMVSPLDVCSRCVAIARSRRANDGNGSRVRSHAVLQLVFAHNGIAAGRGLPTSPCTRPAFLPLSTHDLGSMMHALIRIKESAPKTLDHGRIDWNIRRFSMRNPLHRRPRGNVFHHPFAAEGST